MDNNSIELQKEINEKVLNDLHHVDDAAMNIVLKAEYGDISHENSI